MNEKAWAYYSSAADDEITVRENHAAYHRYVIRNSLKGFFHPLMYPTQYLVPPKNSPKCYPGRLVNEDSWMPFKYAHLHCQSIYAHTQVLN